MRLSGSPVVPPVPASAVVGLECPPRRFGAVVSLALALAVGTGCIKGSLDQLASPGSLQDVHTILNALDLPGHVGALVQEVLDVGRENLDDDAWDALLTQASTAWVDEAMPAVRVVVTGVGPKERAAMIDGVRGTLRQMASERGPHAPEVIAQRVSEAIVTALGPSVSETARVALLAELVDAHSATNDKVVAGPDPFARLMARNLALGFIDGASQFDPGPIHRFLDEERRAFSDDAAASILWWKTSFWVASGAAGLGLVGISFQLYRDVRSRRRNARTLRLLAGAIKSRESDPAMRELLMTIADPQDPDAARNLSDFYVEHPDLRLNLRSDPPRHDVADQEST